MICIKKRNFLILLISIFIFICFVNNAEAAGPDFNVSNCTNIKEPGLYWLNETINSTAKRCLNITVDDVILDCREFSINGTHRNAKDGIHINSSNVIVRNCRIKQFAIGINLSSAINISLINNTVFDNNVTGIFLSSSNSSLLENNTAYANNGTGYDNYGIHLVNSKNNRLVRNNASFNGDGDAGGNIGIFLSTSTDNNLTYNIANNNTEHGIGITGGDHNRLVNNTASKNANIGIFLDTNTNNNLLINNTANNQSNAGCYGISLSNSDNNNLTNNKAIDNEVGIRLDGSSRNILLLNVYLSNNSRGISLEANSDNNTLDQNIANNNTYGIHLDASDNNTISLNTVKNNSIAGIFLKSFSDNNTIGKNIVNKNIVHGIYFDASSENKIINNTCNNNGIGNGIHLQGQSDLNTFRSNTILYNGLGYDIGGNSVNNTFTLCNLSNPVGWDIHMEVPGCQDNKFYNITVFSNGTIASYKTIFSFTKYNRSMHLKGVETPETPPPAGLVSIGKYVNIFKKEGSWVVLNISYSDADVANVNESTLKMYRFNGTWKELNSTVNIALNIVSANLSNYSNFGLFGEELPEDNGNGNGAANTGGSSGKSYAGLIIYYDFDLKKGITKEFRRQDYFDFTRKGIHHKMTVTEVNTLNKQVTIKIASTPRLYTIDEGQTIKIDTDNNGYYDLSISFDKLEDISVVLTMIIIDENIPIIQPPVRELEYTEPVEEKEEIKQVEEVKEIEQVSESKGIDKGTAVALIIVLFFVLIGLIIVIKIIKKRRKEILLRKIKRFLNLRKKIWTPFKSWKQKKQPWNPFRKEGKGNLWNPLKKK